MTTNVSLRLRRVSLIAVASLLALAGAGAFYERAGARRDRQRLPQVGRSVDVGGRSMNIFCSGEGTPAVILDSGAGSSGIAWSHIQPQIAATTRACWFDRAGLGWSDPARFPRTSAVMSAELHDLLQAAGVSPPYVLVGHSLGGLNARVYNGMYPADVAGAVLVDAAHEDEPRRAPPPMRGYSAPRWLWRPIWVVGEVAQVTGLLRLLTPAADLPAAGATREQIVAALAAQPKSSAVHFDASMPESYAQAERAAGFGNKPLIVLTRGRVPPSGPNASEEERQVAAYERMWMHELQPKLAKLSTRGRQVIVSNSGHGIPREAPDAVIHAVREVVAEVRGQVPVDPVAPVYRLVLGLTFHGVPGTRMVLKDMTVPMRPLTGTDENWRKQFDQMPSELLQRARGNTPSPPTLLTTAHVPSGVRLVPHDTLDKLFTPQTSPDRNEFERHFQAAGWVAVSDVLWSADGHHAFVYYASWCGGLCGQGGYIWARRDAADGPWRVARSVVSWFA
jgi:pimeloyl-ACP methyl ester carboxylesterase